MAAVTVVVARRGVFPGKLRVDSGIAAPRCVEALRANQLVIAILSPVVLFTHFFPIAVERDHVIIGGVFGFVIGDLDQAQFDLQRRCSNQPRKLRFSPDLVGHQIEKADTQGADILAVGGILGHQHDTLFLKGEGAGRSLGIFMGMASAPVDHGIEQV